MDKDAISTPGMGGLGSGSVSAVTGPGGSVGRGSGNKKARRKLKKQITSNRKSAAGRKSGRRKKG